MKDRNIDTLMTKLKPRLEQALELNKTAPNGIELEKFLYFLLDKYNTGNYYGWIAVRFSGTAVFNPKEVERTHKLEDEYEG